MSIRKLRLFAILAALLSVGFDVILLARAKDRLPAPPAKEVVPIVAESNTRFGLNLYAKLTTDSEVFSRKSGNLFFSPYSISLALAMTAEGARDQTAAQMGEVLGYPDVARGKDDRQRPWRTDWTNQGMAALNTQLTERDASTDAQLRKRADELQQVHEAAQMRTKEMQRKRMWREANEAAEEERHVANELNSILTQLDPYTLRIANSLWAEKTYPFQQDYVDTIVAAYGTGGLFPCDFKNQFPNERVRINEWVADKTENRIRDIVPKLPPAEAKLMRLILVNAIYFKGEWLEPFAEQWTTAGDFFLSNGLTVKTQMMKVSDLEHARYAAFNAVGTFFETPTMIRSGENVERYPGKDGFAIVELPYKGNRLAMVVIAPNSNDGLTAIEEQFSATILREWLVKLRQRAVHVHMPKFKLETYYALKKPLQSLGMVDAFVDPGRTGPPPPNTANFTGISEMNLWITKVLHKAFI